jgi:hypothetical protein
MTNTIHTHDNRHEERYQNASYLDGQPQEETTEMGGWSYHGQYKPKLVVSGYSKYRLGVTDRRTVFVTIDTWGETEWGEIPTVLADRSDGRISHFHVDNARFTWTRKFDDKKQGEWEISAISVSGDSYRKDGTRGQITGYQGFVSNPPTYPLPQWLQTIVDRTHPVTGVNPFTFGDEHVYGRFGAQEAVV